MTSSSCAANVGRELMPGVWVVECDRDAPLDRVALRIGVPIESRPGGGYLDRLTPMESDAANRRSPSRSHGLGRFPFHTDAAHHRATPDYVLLRCLHSGGLATPTEVVDGCELLADQDLAENLRLGTWLVNGGPTYGRFYRPVLKDSRLRLDPGCMSPANAPAERATDLLEQRIVECKIQTISWQSGLAVLIDNSRILHGRPPAKQDGRELERVMIRTTSQ